jgi:5-oxoprolinase (ATP-hydrolysing)
MARDAWDVWIDTGGTFTDCVAIDPRGSRRTAKVLSTSAVRGTIRSVLGDRFLRVESRWGGAPGLVSGFGFRLVGGGETGARVISHDRRTGRLELDRPPAGCAPGVDFELTSAEEAPILATRMVMKIGSGDPLPPLRMRLATTRGTNALLQRTGAPVALFVTAGFADILAIGDQRRSDLFSLRAERPPALTHAVVEVRGRLAADGKEIAPLDPDALRSEARAALAGGAGVAAVALMHADVNPEHEILVEAILRETGFPEVSRSSDLAPSIHLLQRAATATADAYLTPALAAYLHSVRTVLEEGREEGERSLHLMTSAGGLVRPGAFRPKDSLLSGPAGGVVGATAAAAECGAPRIIAFDMGGTSTDVSRFDGDFEYIWRHSVGDVELIAPALAIETVAAGGGSVCAVDAAGLRVGPESAGAAPGPACYGAGGPLTLTDCNLLLGRLDPANFEIPVSAGAARQALDDLRGRVAEQTGEQPEVERLAAGLIDIADQRMADAIRAVSLRRGYDPAEYTLVVFGGAGGQHGCGVADLLEIRTQIIPPEVGLLSARGLGHAVLERIAERQLLAPLDEAQVLEVLDELGRSALDELRGETGGERLEVRRRIANLRYSGQLSTLGVEVAGKESLRDSFERLHERVFGHSRPGHTVEVESLRAIASTLPPEREAGGEPPASDARPSGTKRLWSRVGDGWREVPTFRRGDLLPGSCLAGPCIVLDPHSTIVVDAGWSGRVTASGAIVLERRDPRGGEGNAADGRSEAARPEAVREKLFAHRFEALVGEMGEQLRRTSVSTNVKERLDFSCALLDPLGELVANAPHIPVHLGAMGLCVRSVTAALPMGPGDVVVTNHPGFGGSHLPDITVITPVFGDRGEHLGYVANRAHHAEIGGSRPGSMPPHATTLEEEGVVIPPTRLVEEGVARWDRLETLLAKGRWPTRSPQDNLADLNAQVAANRRGEDMLRRMARRYGADAVRAYMEALTRRAAASASAAIARLPRGVHRAEELLDDGRAIRVEVTVGGGGAHFDFEGTAAPHPGNLNATPAIVRSAILYVLRLLVDEPLPLNEGLLRPVTVALPRCLLNPDFSREPLPAVVGGNTEVSQRLVDTLLRALGAAACSQGTMNNLLWGNLRFGYYETIGGGAGAVAGHDGGSAVHSHMTNTRITDAEVLERRYPVRVERFAIRRGSGGAGRWNGGDGIVREVTFLEPMSLSILSQHRVVRPYGVAGGEPGQPGRQWITRAGGGRLDLGPVDGCEVGAGDRLTVETPGGGGWGDPAERPPGR